MPLPPPSPRYRFGVFEVEVATGELRRQGMRVRLSAQPFQVLCLLLARPGELLSRDEIAGELWAESTFVDSEHGVNSAVNRIREALGDTAKSPRFVETLARRGYRFLGPVERLDYPGERFASVVASHTPQEHRDDPTQPVRLSGAAQIAGSAEVGAAAERTLPTPTATGRATLLSSAGELPGLSPLVVRTLFCLLQAMYLGFYVGALANLPEIDDLYTALLPFPAQALGITLATAAVLIPARAFVLSAALLQPPGAKTKLLTLWRYLLVADELWALSPFLLLHHISFGLALACTALLVYAPFAQRSLVLMGAADPPTSGLLPTA